MLNRILTIARNAIYLTYTDRNALLFMLAMPVAISTIIGLAFGSGDNDVNLETTELIVINQDAGATNQNGTFNYGKQNYEDVLVTNPPQELSELIDAELATDIEESRQKVKDGEARGMLVIPSDFSAKLLNGQPASVELYYNPGDEIQVVVLQSVIDQLTSALNTGLVAVQLSSVNPEIQNNLPVLFSGQANTTITLNQVNVEGEANTFDSLSYFAPSMAIFFMTFAMAAGTRAILEEQRLWTLQRIMTTPTPRWAYMLGRLLGTYASGLIQMLLLIILTSLIAVMLGREGNIWGDNYIGLTLIILAVVAAATGLGLLIAAVSKTITQADGLSSAALTVMGVIGGSFIPVSQVKILDTLSKFSLNYWGIDGFTDLANNNAPVSEIVPNAAALMLMAGIFFIIALWRFGKRLDI